MNQTPVSSDASPAQSDCCPECKGKRTRPTIATARGSYRRCEDCGHVWHQDAKANTLDN